MFSNHSRMDRLFVAIDIPDEIKNKFVGILEGLRRIGAKVVPTTNIHLTLKFIGETDKTQEVVEALKDVRLDSFDLVVSDVGIFGSIEYPRVFWVGVEKNSNLGGLYEVIESKLNRLGIPRDEREFSPHITLARFKTRVNSTKLQGILKENNKNFGSFRVSSFVLYKSILSQPDPIYQKISEFHLNP